jgi:lipopolysaccharide transport system permease protein
MNFTPGLPITIYHPVQIIGHLWQHRNLIRLLSRRELQASYRGAMLGIGWTIIQPLMMLCVYTFVFAVIFKGRWGVGGADESRVTFALVLFLGLITFRIISEMMNSSAQLVVSNSAFVKKVLFPLEILPVVRLIRILIDVLISLLVLAAGVLIFRQPIHPGAWLLPVIWLPVIVLSLAVGYILAALGVFIRDVGQLAGILTTLLFFTSAIFYPIDVVPAPYQVLFRMNPIAVFVDFSRNAVFYGVMPDWIYYAVWLGAAVLMWMLGYSFFMASRRAFSDVV